MSKELRAALKAAGLMVVFSLAASLCAEGCGAGGPSWVDILKIGVGFGQCVATEAGRIDPLKFGGTGDAGAPRDASAE